MNHSEILWDKHHRLTQDKKQARDQGRTTRIKVARDNQGKAQRKRTILHIMTEAKKAKHRTANE
jgi:hypothetical protein